MHAVLRYVGVCFIGMMFVRGMTEYGEDIARWWIKRYKHNDKEAMK